MMQLFRVAPVQRNPGRPVLFTFIAFVSWLNSASLLAAPTIAYVQGNYSTPQSPQTTVNVTFTAPQSAGDLNVLVVGWNESTAVVNAVTDTSGNVYTRAVGPTVISGSLSQSIYYAKNIASAPAGANTVTVVFSIAAVYSDIRILEYSGVDPNSPVDVTAAATGNSTLSSSGSATTAYDTELLVAANTVLTSTTGPGNGFTSRMITAPDGDIAEDEIVTAAGSYSASAPLNSSGPWIMQMVAFRAAGASAGGACDLNQDGAINVLDVQLATNMYLSPQTCTVTVDGTPVCNLQFVTAVATATLSGGCSMPILGTSPSSIAFGNVVVGSSAAQVLTLSNTGTGTLTVSSSTVTGVGFSISGLTLPLTLGAGQSTSLNVIFAPTVAGSASGNLTFTSNALNSPTDVAISGTAVTGSAHSVALTWAASTSLNVVGYNVYRGTVSGGPYTKLNSALIAGTAYTDGNVQSGLTYYYVATAVDNNSNESAHSNEARAPIP